MNASIESLIKRMQQAAESIAIEPPQIVLDIFQRGIVKSQAGTRGQYFSTLVFIQGVCRSLAYDCVNNFIYMIDEEILTKEQLVVMLPRYFRSNANFLGYCGFDEVWDFAKSIIALLDEVDSKEQLNELVSVYNVYLASLYTWVQHYFPWKLGDAFPLRVHCNAESVEA